MPLRLIVQGQTRPLRAEDVQIVAREGRERLLVTVEQDDAGLTIVVRDACQKIMGRLRICWPG